MVTFKSRYYETLCHSDCPGCVHDISDLVIVSNIRYYMTLWSVYDRQDWSNTINTMANSVEIYSDPTAQRYSYFKKT